MIAHNSKIIGEGLTYDDVLLVPNYSNVLPREVSIKIFKKRLTFLLYPLLWIQLPKVLWQLLWQEGGIGVLHKI
jgi:IMP dehydrogenase